MQLPSLIMLTDRTRIGSLDALIANLPVGTAIIFRDYDLPDRVQAAQVLMSQARKRRLRLLIGGDGRLAARLHADGVHLPEYRAREARRWKKLRPDWLVTVAAHSIPALRRAECYGADAALLSPVFPTASHPGSETLRPVRFAGLVQSTKLPVFALGGINADNCNQMRQSGAVGLAGIGFYSMTHQK